MKAFDKLKTGDKVDIDYYQSLAVSLAPTGSKPSTTERRGRAVDMGGGVRGREVDGDGRGRQRRPQRQHRDVQGAARATCARFTSSNPTLQEKLPSLKPGQVVQFDYTQATAASIRPSK